MVSERVLSGCASASFPFLGLSQEKKWGAWQVPFFTKGMLHTNCCACAALSLFLPLWGPRWLTGSAPELSSLIIDKRGPKSRQRCGHILLAFQEGQRSHYHSRHLECPYREEHQKSPALEPISPREIASFCNPLFTHSSSSSRGRLK